MIDYGLEYIHTFSEDFSIHLNLIIYSKNGDGMFLRSVVTDEMSCMVEAPTRLSFE